MGIPRRFLNMIVSNGVPGVRSLCRIDLMMEPLFDATMRPELANKPPSTKQMEMIPCPRPILTFKASASAPNDQPKMDCFPLSDSRVICTDHLGRAFHLDAQARVVGSIPSLHKPKSKPVSLFVPTDNAADDIPCPDDADRGTLFVMERIPKLELGCCEQYSYQFEAFVFGTKPLINYYSFSNSWDCQLLPPPPFVREPNYCHRSPEIISYTILEGGSHICMSVKGAGTYCMDTVSHAWDHVGDWMLPFYGKVEYVPELKLWIGLSAEDRHLAAADLSDMGSQSQPQLVTSPCKEFDPPEEWKECSDSQLINLGNGNFCIARFFNFGDQNFAVFTGVEVVPLAHDANTSFSTHVNGGNGKVKVRMIPHISRCHDSNGSVINALF